MVTDTPVQYGYADVEIPTFHAFGDRILREHALEMGLQPDFRVLNRAEQVTFIRDRLFEFPRVHYRRSAIRRADVLAGGPDVRR